MRSNSNFCFHFKKAKATLDLKFKFKLQTKCKFGFFFLVDWKQARKKEGMKDLGSYLGGRTFFLDGLQHL
jgi:hypothetical protein